MPEMASTPLTKMSSKTSEGVEIKAYVIGDMRHHLGSTEFRVFNSCSPLSSKFKEINTWNMPVCNVSINT